MRIAYITHYAQLYGANRSMLDLILEARGRGAVEPFVLLPREGPLTERLGKEGVPHAVLPWEPWMSDRRYMGGPHHRLGQFLRYRAAARERAAVNRRALPGILELLADRRVDLVHVNSAAVGITAMLEEALTVPLVWHIRELPEKQYLLHLDTGTGHYGRALRSADRLIAISEAVRADIRRYAGEGTAVDLIYNGVLSLAGYQQLAATAEERWERTGAFTFLLAGLIHPSKGQEEAIRAVAIARAKVPDIRLIIAGDGRADHLRALVGESGLESAVTFPGFVEDMAPLLRDSHALLMCSRNEAMGRVTVEAMGNGLPVIGHRSGGTVELIEDEVSGLLYPGGAAELADRMVRLATDRSLARRLGRQAMRSSAERFNIERYASEVLAVYDSVLSPAR